VTDSPIDSPSGELAGRMIRVLPHEEAAAALPRALAGDRDPAALAAGLDPLHTAIVRTTLARLDPAGPLPPSSTAKTP
jgi:hypothetical protein